MRRRTTPRSVGHLVHANILLAINRKDMKEVIDEKLHSNRGVFGVFRRFDYIDVAVSVRATAAL